MEKFKNNKKTIIVCIAVAVLLVLIGVLIFSPNTVDEECDWCGRSPSVEYELKAGGKSYVCKDCSEVCAWCDEKATRHYENLAEMMVFVCDDCYEDIN